MPKDQERGILPDEVLEHEVNELWQLDIAQDEIAALDKSDSIDKTATDDDGDDTANANALSDFPLPSNPAPPTTLPRLTLPVILPQRAPYNRQRGFVRAYAPALAAHSIPPSAFLEFIDRFNRSTAADPRFNAINLASIGTLFLPTAIGIPVSLAISHLTKLALELDARGKTTKELARVNREFFRPRGLHCLIGLWDPTSDRAVVEADISCAVARPCQDTYRSADVKSGAQTQIPFPAVAPLVFPSLDELAALSPDAAEKKKGQLAAARSIGFVLDYWDRRATAAFKMAHPGTPLSAVPPPQFRSRYADPTSHAANGSLISFLSGGKLVPGPESRGLVGGLASVVGQAARSERQGEAWEEWDRVHPEGTKTKTKKRRGVIGNVIHKMALRPDVLYMMIVNLPSDEEMAAAAGTYPGV